MKRMFVFAAAAALVVAVAAQADPLANTYGNTVTRIFPDGTKVITYFNADKTWEERSGNTVTKGTFVLKDDTQVCMTVTDPAPSDATKATSCHTVYDHKVGDTWTGATPEDQSIKFSLTAGR